MRAELQHLWSVVRREVVKALADAAAEGDRSENAEYIYRKKQLGEIDRRVRYLSKRLDTAKVVSEPPTDRSKVRFGALVTLSTVDEVTAVYRVVGADETDARKGWISIDSPLALALLGKQAGDEVTVILPGGSQHFEILEIDYPGFDTTDDSAG